MSKKQEQTDLETDPRFPSGPWTGFFLQPLVPGRHLMELRLTFRRGEVKGEGRDWKLTRASRPARIFESRTPDVNAPLSDREYMLKFVLTSLDKYVGYRMSVNATLMGEAGRDGLNVRGISPVSATCE